MNRRKFLKALLAAPAAAVAAPALLIEPAQPPAPKTLDDLADDDHEQYPIVASGWVDTGSASWAAREARRIRKVIG